MFNELKEKYKLLKNHTLNDLAGINVNGILLSKNSNNTFEVVYCNSVRKPQTSNLRSQDRFDDYRKQLHDGDISLLEICRKEKLSLAFDLIHFYNRWITPAGRPRRFDTRFFITSTPGVQSGLHDGKETVDSCWISPNQALELSSKDKFGMMPVTEKQLSEFASYKTADEFLAMAANNTDFPTYNPSLHPIDD